MQVDKPQSGTSNQAFEVFRNIFEAAPSAFVLADAEGKIVLLNIETEFLFRYDRKELVGQPMNALVPEKLKETFNRFLESFFKNQRSTTISGEHGLRGLRRNGTDFPIELRLCPMEAAGKKLALCTVLDLTKQARLVETIEEKKRLFDLLSGSSLAGFWDWNLETDEQHISAHWKARLGFQEGEVENHASAFQKLIHPEDLDLFRKAFREHTENGKPFAPVLRFRHKSGAFVWAVCQGAAVKDDSGKFVRMVGNHTDITALKDAEQELRAAFEKLEAERESLDSAAQASQSELSAAQEAAKQAEAQVAQLSSQLQAKEQEQGADLEKLRAELQQAREEQRRAEEAAQNSQSEIAAQVSSHAEALEKVRARLEDVTHEKRKIEDALRDAQAELERREKDKASSTERLEAALLEESNRRRRAEEEARKRKEDQERLASESNATIEGLRSQIEDQAADGELQEKMFRSAVEASPHAMVLTDADGSVQLANSAAGELFGCESRQLEGRPVAQLFPKRLREELGKLIADFNESPRAIHLDEEHGLCGLRIDGEEFPAELTLRPAETAQGTVLLAALTDVTERKQQRARFQEALESSPGAMLVADADGKIVRLNSETESLFGFSREELRGRKLTSLLAKSDREACQDSLARLLRERRPQISLPEMQARRKDGSAFPVEIRVRLTQTGSGPRLLTAILDLGERKQAEAQFQAAMESAPTAMVMADEEGRMVLANSKTRELFGYDAENLLGQPMDILVPARCREQHASYLRGFFETSTPCTVGSDAEFFGLRQDGGEFPVELSLHPIQTREGRFALSAIVDTSERKRSREAQNVHAIQLERKNQEIRDAQGRLEDALRNLKAAHRHADDFAHFAAHELGASLRAIANLSHRIVEEAQDNLPADSRQQLEQLRRRASEVEGRIQDAFRFAGGGQNEGPDNTLQGFVGELLERLEPPEAFQFDLPEEAQALEVQDPRELAQVFGQILGYAIKRHDRLDGRIRIDAHNDRESAEFEVADDGPALSDEIRSKILNPEAGDEASLGTARTLVERHGGKLVVSSNGSRGAAFRFRWPRQKAG